MSLFYLSRYTAAVLRSCRNSNILFVNGAYAILPGSLS